MTKYSPFLMSRTFEWASELDEVTKEKLFCPKYSTVPTFLIIVIIMQFFLSVFLIVKGVL